MWDSTNAINTDLQGERATDRCLDSSKWSEYTHSTAVIYRPQTHWPHMKERPVLKSHQILLKSSNTACIISNPARFLLLLGADSKNCVRFAQACQNFSQNIMHFIAFLLSMTISKVKKKHLKNMISVWIWARLQLFV